MKYKVMFRYHGKFSVEVEADSEEEAAKIGQTEAEEEVTDFLRLDCVDIQEVTEFVSKLSARAMK